MRQGLNDSSECEPYGSRGNKHSENGLGKKDMSLTTKRLCYIVGLVLVFTSLANAHAQESDSHICPEIVSASELSIPLTLYYVMDIEEAQLWAFREGETYKLNFYVTPWSVLQISPEGTHILHFIGRWMFSPHAHIEASVLVYSLPLLASDLPIIEQAIASEEEPSFQGGAGWINNQEIYLHLTKNQTTVINIEDGRQRQLSWPEPTDLWENTVWGGLIPSNDFNYFVYPAALVGEGFPNPRTGEAYLRLVAASNLNTSYSLLPGYLGTVRWQRGGDSFVFQHADASWYRLNVEPIITASSDIYRAEGLTVFHKGVGARLYAPSLSADGRYLSGLAYLPNKQLSTLLILPAQTDTITDTCIHGNYIPQISNSNSVSAVWSPDNRYIAFAVSREQQTSLYIFDVQNNLIGLVSIVEDNTTVQIVGWGS